GFSIVMRSDSSERAGGSSAGAVVAEAPRLEGYRVVEEIGRGGMGVVYKAEHEVLGRAVAIKALDLRLQNEARWLERFLDEARHVARMTNHEHIVQVHDVARDAQGRYYIVMEHVDGACLSDKLFAGDGAGLGLAETVRVVAETAF